jgi:hypothetical protein
LSDLEPSPDVEDTGAGGGLGAFLNSAPRVIGSITALIGAVTGLLIALNKVGWLDGDGPKSETADSIFGPLERPPIGRVYFDGKTMYVKASKPRNPILHLANLDEPLDDVSMTARVGWLSGAKDYAVSFICRYDSPANYYVLSVLSGPPRYNIIRYRDQRPISLTGGIKPTDDLNEDPNLITAKCVSDDPTILTLQANGQTIDTAKDADGIESGNIGVRVRSDESIVTIRFDDFVLKHL